MHRSRLSVRSCALSAALAGAAVYARPPAPADAQDCPTAQSGKGGFVIERGGHIARATAPRTRLNTTASIR